MDEKMKHAKTFKRVGCLFSRGEKSKRASRHGRRTWPEEM
jgi:hypothetical protein